MENTADALGMFAGILLIAAFIMTSIRAMRMFGLAAGVAALMMFATNPDKPLPIILAALFILVNGVQLGVLMSRSRMGRLLVDERGLFAEVLAIDRPKEQARLRDLMTWRDIRKGHFLMEQGQKDPPLVYIARGRASIEHDGTLIGMCGAGDFAGEMSLVSGDPATATVTAEEDMRIAQFDRDALGHFSREVPELGNAISAALNRGLAAKVARMNAKAALGKDD
jgi:hypothetical protein